MLRSVLFLCPLVGDLGERKLIEILQKFVADNGVLGFGDDASAFKIAGKIVVINTDMLVKKTDVPKDMKPFQIGQRLVVMCLSDIVAKGAAPKLLLAAFGIPPEYDLEEFLEIVRGISQISEKYGAKYVGGDLNTASNLIISGTAIGIAEKALIKRSGAKAGDILCVTGSFGLTGAGFKIILENAETPKHLHKIFIDAVFSPKIQLKLGLMLAESGMISACIDSSDGLAWSIHELSKASKVGFEITNLEAIIPEEVFIFAEKNQIDPYELALYGGEEFELVLTVPKEQLENTIKIAKKAGSTLTPIGKATLKEKIFFKKGEKKIPIKPKGYEHLKTK
jgi:thiamine-monophosphate kinase